MKNKMISIFDVIEINVKKGENAGRQYFLLLPTNFSKGVKTYACLIEGDDVEITI